MAAMDACLAVLEGNLRPIQDGSHFPFEAIRSHSKPTQPGTSGARDMRITAEDSTQGVSFRKRMAGVRVSLMF